MVGGPGGVVEDQGVVLIGRERLLHPGAGAEGHPAVGHGSGPEPVGRQREHAGLDGIADRGDDPADVCRARVLAHQRGDDRRQSCGDLGHSRCGGLLGDITREVDRIGALEPHQVGGRDDTDDPIALDQRQVVNRARDHFQQGLEGQPIGAGGDRIWGHDARKRPARVHPCREHAIAQVAIGDDARESVTIHDQERGDTPIRHHLGGGADARPESDGDRLAAQQLAHPGLKDHASGLAGLLRAQRPGQPRGVLGIEEGGEGGLLGHQFREGRGVDRQGEGVLDRDDTEDRRVVPEQGRGAKTGAALPSVDEPPVGVADVDGAGPHDIQPVVVPARDHDRAAPAVILHLRAAGEARDRACRQGVEGRVLSQEVSDLRQLDIERHTPIVPGGRAAGRARAGEKIGRSGGEVMSYASCCGP